MIVSLRPVEDSDLSALFEHQRDPEANLMAAFGPAEPDSRTAFEAHWHRVRANPDVVARTIDVNGRVAGSIIRWRDETLDAPEISYWIGREFWGRGVATAAVVQFVAGLPDARLYGRAASTNPASARVLQKCGFRTMRVERGVTATDGRIVDELVLRLDRP